MSPRVVRASASRSASGRRENLRRQAGQRQGRFQLHAAQYDFVECAERFAFYVGGRGAGKTYAGAVKALTTAAARPHSLGLIGAPTYGNLRDFAQRTFFELCPAGLVRIHHRTENTTELTNGAEILWRPAHEVDRYRGLNLSWYWLDEAPYCGFEAWRILKATLRQPGYPTMAWCTGTPLGQDGYARDFELERKPRHALFRASTRANLRNLPESFIDDLGYAGEMAEQEIEGLFVGFSGLVYRFLRDVHVRPARADQQFSRVVGGVDWGYTNPTAALVFGLDGDARAWQLAEYYARRASLHDTRIPAIVELTKRYGVRQWWCDAEDPGAIADLQAAINAAGLQSRASAVVKGPGSVADGIQTVTRALAVRGDGLPGLLVAPECVNTIAEYGVYRYPSVPEGTQEKRDPRDEPIKQSDHALDATRYALHAELGQAARTESYLAEMQRRLEALKEELALSGVQSQI